MRIFFDESLVRFVNVLVIRKLSIRVCTSDMIFEKFVNDATVFSIGNDDAEPPFSNDVLHVLYHNFYFYHVNFLPERMKERVPKSFHVMGIFRIISMIEYGKQTLVHIAGIRMNLTS